VVLKGYLTLNYAVNSIQIPCVVKTTDLSETNKTGHVNVAQNLLQLASNSKS